jgi:16S rRNA U516 pseudouridylate synthase RsuA-like enzyme
MKKPTPKTSLFPMRINKFLAHNGYSTRRGADEIIEKRWVTINGKVAVLGDKVNETDNVEVRNNKKAEDYLYYAFHKPAGISSEKAVASRDFFPVLPLDSHAEGLMIVTNDRRIIDRLANPDHKHVKEYTVKTIQPLRPNFKDKMEEAGMGTVHVRNERNFSIRVTDVGNRIREMSSKFFAEIESLKRTKILNIELGGLQVNDRREIKDEELSLFLKSLGL